MTARETSALARDDPTDRELVRLLAQLDDLLERLDAAQTAWSDWLAATAPEYSPSANNLVHYWAMRQCDLRELQSRLAAFRLSSLGRSEPHVQATLRLVRCAVAAMLEGAWQPPEPSTVRRTAATSHATGIPPRGTPRTITPSLPR